MAVGDMVIYFLDGLIVIVFVCLILSLSVCCMKYRRNKQSMEDVEDVEDAVGVCGVYTDTDTNTKDYKKFQDIYPDNKVW